jgi:hypothetical protein
MEGISFGSQRNFRRFELAKRWKISCEVKRKMRKEVGGGVLIEVD